MPSLYAAITPHGYGHGAITLPVLAVLAELVPALRLAVVGGPPEGWVRGRLALPLALHDRRIDDPGMVNADANTVLPAPSLAAYRDLFARFEDVVAAEMARQRAFRPDLVLSNVGFVPLEAARRLGIPAVALAPFHWGQIFGAYCGGAPEAAPLLERLRDIHARADLFLATTPFVPMPDLANVRAVPPVCGATGARRPEDLRAALGVPAKTRLALMTMGGMGGPLPVEHWPRFPGWRLIVCAPDTASDHPDVVASKSLPFDFQDLMASVDVVITKPGYGTVVECAAAGIPILYRQRNDWPETPHMMGWARMHVGVEEMDAKSFRTGDFLAKLQSLLQRPAGPPARSDGAAVAAGLLRGFL